MSQDIYRDLQQKLDKFSMGFPPTESGIEIKILKHLFSKDDAEMFLAMSHRLETAESVAARLGLPGEDVAERLEDMAERGLLFRVIKGASRRYAAIPFVHGLFEFQVKDLDRELAQMVEDYSEEGFDLAMQQGAEHFLRPIPVHRSIPVQHNVASHDDAVKILASMPRIVVTDCICRKKSQVMDQGCGKPLEACFMFGSMGQYYLDRGMGREVSLEEGVRILEDCREAGLVTQPATAQNPGGMCNCCGDCCGVLRSLNKHPKPASMVLANHFAVVDSEECTGCGTCLERCQIGAIALDGDDQAQVNLDRCIGCGLCVTHCPGEALRLEAKPGDQMRVPPASASEQMILMAQKRGLI
ncbi:MAG: 4Fe-4S binding protein [Desulfarculaceae bacterium]|nr:4Fe-4S binding protein [Desulfarculaceae bacterium]MCF8073014.1 4Fe-4S binding protein [Desulfarculaceae bacterium]MCF8101901.1 4Fe-4S binding protein [Desulfarculaceae bacterium]MCF8115428.1 4Fe-4S binding protein [Desulfarculaceae bacterium]